MAINILLGSENITFVAGNQYRFAGGGSLLINVLTSVTVPVVTPAVISAEIAAGKMSVVSGLFGNPGPTSTNPINVSIVSNSAGTTAQIEYAVAEAALRDTLLAAKINTHTQKIADLETAAAGKAVIDDTSTGTDKVLSASKTISLIGSAQTAAEAFATTAASNAQTAAEAFATTAASNAQTAAQNYANTAINNLVAGAPAALDTLKEIADQIAADESGVAALVSTVGTKITESQANALIAAVVGDPATVSTAAIFASMAFTLA